MRHRAALVAALLAVVVTTAVLALLRRDGAPPLIPGSAQRLTFDAALDLDPAISPDGARMAYVSDAEDFPRLYVTDLSTGTSEPLTGDFPLPQRSPRWSPDGSIISFQSGVRLYSVPSGGGVPEILVEPPPNEWVAYHAWSPDGSELVYVKMYELHVRSSAGGDSRAVTGPLPDPHSPAWSPDGRWIAFVSGNSAFVFGASERPGGVNLGNVGPSSIWLVPASGGDPIRVTDDASLNTSPAWLPSGRSLLFVSSRGGDRDVYRIDLAADGTPVGEPVRVTAGLGAHGISVSGDGTRLAYSAFRNSSNVWSAPLRAGGTARPVTSGTQSIEGLALSPDGRSLAFDSDRGGNQDIYTVSLNGGAPVRMTTSRADDFMPHWSPDGREIAYHTFVPGATRRLHVLNLADGTVTEVADAAGDQRFPGWSPDGRSLLYESVDGGLWSLYRVSRDDEGRWQQPVMLTTQAGAARWSPDGRSIVYRGSEGLWVAAADHGERRLVVAVDSTATDELGNVEWTPDGRRLIYKRIGAGALVSFWSVPASGGTPRLLLDLSDQRFASPRPELATDGERVYFTVAARESDVWVMELTGANR